MLLLAPLRGVTEHAFRIAFNRHFPGLTEAVTPFIATVHGTRIKPKLLADVLPRVADLPLVPQILGRDPALLRNLLLALRGLGYTRANLNAGCPWPMVVKRRRGAGLLADPETLAALLETGCGTMPGGFSLKVRLGIDTPDTLIALLPLINQFPLEELIIHPRTARQMYTGHADPGAFAAAANLTNLPLVYNGDIFTLPDFQTLRARFPAIRRWMLGRGLIRDPFLAQSILADAPVPRDPSRLLAFHQDYLVASIAELSGDRPVLGRMKELWSYLHHSFRHGPQLLRAIQHSTDLDEYRRLVAMARPK